MFSRSLLCMALLSVPLAAAPAAASALPPPIAPVGTKTFQRFGVRREDPYYWMRQRDDPRVRAYLEAENAYADQVSSTWKELEERLYAELRARVVETDTSTPYRYGSFWYYIRTEAGRDYPIYCRKREALDAPEEIYLDVNRLAEGHAFFDLGYVEVSPDGRRLAYATDLSGAEDYILYFLDLESGQLLPDSVPNVAWTGVWADNQTFFYVREDASKRPDRVFRHTLGSSKKDPCVLREKDARFSLSLDRSQDGAVLFALSESKNTTEVFSLRADQPKGPWHSVAGRTEGIRYEVDHRPGEFLLRTNEGAPRYRIVAMPDTHPCDRSQWRTVVAGRSEVELEEFFPLRKHLIVHEQESGQDRIRILDEAQGTSWTLHPSDPVGVLATAANAEFETHTLQLYESSPIRPGVTFSVDLDTQVRTDLKHEPSPSGFSSSDYTVTRRDVRSADGTAVPLIIFHRRDVPLDGTAPGYLYGYGAYGMTDEPAFVRSWLSFMERGVVCAIAQPRGSGFLGEAWYEAGKLEHKQHTFDDFIACAAYLAQERFIAPDRLAIEGGSAGGLLVGAVIHQRPELFRAALAAVPFVDVLTTMSDPTIPLTTEEYEEWGNPQERTAFETIRAYSPYDNVAPRPYPALLITAGLNDSRVQYWEPAKWTARLRTVWAGPRPLLLKTNLGAGHHGASGRTGALKETAAEQAFLLHELGFTH